MYGILSGIIIIILIIMFPVSDSGAAAGTTLCFVISPRALLLLILYFFHLKNLSLNDFPILSIDLFSCVLAAERFKASSGARNRHIFTRLFPKQ